MLLDRAQVHLAEAWIFLRTSSSSPLAALLARLAGRARRCAAPRARRPAPGTRPARPPAEPIGLALLPPAVPAEPAASVGLGRVALAGLPPALGAAAARRSLALLLASSAGRQLQVARSTLHFSWIDSSRDGRAASRSRADWSSSCRGRTLAAAVRCRRAARARLVLELAHLQRRTSKASRFSSWPGALRLLVAQAAPPGVASLLVSTCFASSSSRRASAALDLLLATLDPGLGLAHRGRPARPWAVSQAVASSRPAPRARPAARWRNVLQPRFCSRPSEPSLQARGRRARAAAYAALPASSSSWPPQAGRSVARASVSARRLRALDDPALVGLAQRLDALGACARDPSRGSRRRAPRCDGGCAGSRARPPPRASAASASVWAASAGPRLTLELRHLASSSRDLAHTGDHGRPRPARAAHLTSANHAVTASATSPAGRDEGRRQPPFVAVDVEAPRAGPSTRLTP